MEIKEGYEYTCNLVVHMGLLGKRNVEAIIDVDTPTSFHGRGHMMGKPINFAGMKIDESSYMYFENGVIEGSTFTFEITGKGLTAKFVVQVADNGSITGKANAGGILNIKLTGNIAGVAPLSK